MVSNVQGRDGEDGAYEVVTIHGNRDELGPVKSTQCLIACHGCVRVGGKVVEQLEVKNVKTIETRANTRASMRALRSWRRCRGLGLEKVTSDVMLLTVATAGFTFVTLL